RTNIGRFANRPYSRAQNPHANMGQPLFTTHCSLTSVTRTSIGRFANRPYSRAQNPYVNMG
ncbi:hypothetical protein, partial [Capnocytophaga gingivalis]|uniref:hypothetical protein n=1 Tax=Capnocytophaga gingivalis TaxID=1017 RepID=UPI0028D89942